MSLLASTFAGAAAGTAILFLGAFSTAAQAPTPTSPKQAAPYPEWLEMKDGYAEECILGGGCIPLTRQELAQIVHITRQRTLEACGKRI